MATKRRDVLLPFSQEVPVGQTPDIADESPRHEKLATKHGTISICLRRNARFIVAGILLMLMVGFGTRYIPILFCTPSCYIPHNHLGMSCTHSIDSYHREIRDLLTKYDFDTTVVYIYSGNDELYPDNLNYFLRHGVKEGTIVWVIEYQLKDSPDQPQHD